MCWARVIFGLRPSKFCSRREREVPSDPFADTPLLHNSHICHRLIALICKKRKKKNQDVLSLLARLVKPNHSFFIPQEHRQCVSEVNYCHFSHHISIRARTTHHISSEQGLSVAAQHLSLWKEDPRGVWRQWWAREEPLLNPWQGPWCHIII